MKYVVQSEVFWEFRHFQTSITDSLTLATTNIEHTELLMKVYIVSSLVLLLNYRKHAFLRMKCVCLLLMVFVVLLPLP